MRVLYIHQHFSTPSGAVGTRSYELARRLVLQGHDVVVVCGSARSGATGLDGPFIRGRRRGFVDGIEVIEFDLSYSNRDGFLKRSLTFLSFTWRSVITVLSERADAVVATSTPLTVGIPGIVARWLCGKPFIFEVRDLWPELPRSMGVISNPLVLWSLSILEWASYHSAVRCISLAPGITAGMIRQGVLPSKITMVPNGCDVELFRNPSLVWRPDGVAATDLLAVFAGTHGIANGLDAVLDAAHVLKERGRTDIKLALVGDGSQKARLQARAEREGLRNVIFHPSVEKQKLVGLLASSDIGLQVLANVPAFYYGTSPNKFFDYIAAGLPVLTNYPGWVADMIVEADCGFAVPPDDPAAFANALESAASGRPRLQLMSGNSARLAESTFRRSKLANEWVAWVTGAT